MKNYILSIFLIVVGNISSAQSVSKQDSLEISSKIDDWNLAWKIKDHQLASKWYMKDAEFTNAFGHNKIGQVDIENLLKEVFGLSFVMSGDSKVTNQKFKVIAPNVILVVTTIERLGQKTSQQAELGPRQTTHHRIFKKEKDWLIISHLISDARDRN